MKQYIYAGLLAALLSACTGASDNPLKAQFLAGCVKSGSAKSICSCAFDEIAKQHSQEEVFEMFTDMKHFGKLQTVVADAQKACLL